MLQTQKLFVGDVDEEKRVYQCSLVHIHNFDGMRLDQPFHRQLVVAMDDRPGAILVVGSNQWINKPLADIPADRWFLPKRIGQIYKRLVGRTAHGGRIYLLRRY